MTSGVGANGSSAKYTYLADGTKVDVRDSSNNGFSYLGSLVYKYVNGVSSLESAAFAGGRIEKASNGYDVNFYVTDHLGSVRAVLDGDGMVQGRNDYYPFGESISSAGVRYKFNGKELQTTGGFGLLDYGARMYDSKIGRWLTQDPLAEKYYSMSSYNYCANNPINAIDPDGKDWEAFIKGLKAGISSQIESYKAFFSDPIGSLKNSSGGLDPVSSSVVTVTATIAAESATGWTGEYIGFTVGETAVDVAVDAGTALVGAGVGKAVGAVSKAASGTVSKVASGAKNAADVSKNVLTGGEYARIQNAATRIDKPINVVGSRASGTAKAGSDWDYNIPGIKNSEWKKIKNSLPGSKSILDNTPKNIDIFKTPLDKTKPHLTIPPKN